MGERLVYRCIKNDELIATLYYHWSGYTGTTYRTNLFLVDELLKQGISKESTKEEIQRALISILENDIDCKGCHGGLSGGANARPDDIEAFRAIGYEPLVDGKVNRTNGLIDITSKGMGESLSWAEHLETINFDNLTITNENFSYLTKEVYEREFEENLSNYSKMEVKPHKNMCLMPFDVGVIQDVIEWYDENFLGKSLSFCQYMIGNDGIGRYIVVTE